MGTPNREPTEYSRNRIGIPKDTGRCIPIIYCCCILWVPYFGSPFYSLNYKPKEVCSSPCASDPRIPIEDRGPNSPTWLV